MTWVVGGRHAFCARCISDIQVTLEYANNEKKPGGYVQKVHKISDDLVIAFADCIRLAFAIIEAIKTEYATNYDQRLLSIPNELAKDLIRFIRYKFNKLKRDGERVEFLIFIKPSNPFRDFGLFKCVSPEFKIEQPNNPFQIMEIGSGSEASEYRELINKNSRGFFELPTDTDGELVVVIPVGKIGLQFIYQEALDYQVAGISHAMHIMVIYSEGIVINELPQAPDIPFPKVATTWHELYSNLRNAGVNLKACIAMA